MTDERLSEARKALARYEDRNSKPNPAHLADAIRGLIALADEAPTPTDDEVNAVALAYWGPSVPYDREKLRDALAGFRRTEVPEPSAEPTCEHGTSLTELCAHVERLVNEEPQGEPSDAALRLAERAWMAAYRQEPRERLRAALRAAGGEGR